MAKKPKATKAPAREQSVTLKLSAPEYQLIAYAASKSNIRGVNAWMRTKLMEAAKEKLSDKIAQQILDGQATVALLRESLAESKKPKPPASVTEFRSRR